ncbi:MAG: hypothetical protein AB2A00_35665 [Myxococcota bacterium]
MPCALLLTLVLAAPPSAHLPDDREHTGNAVETQRWDALLVTSLVALPAAALVTAWVPLYAGVAALTTWAAMDLGVWSLNPVFVPGALAWLTAPALLVGSVLTYALIRAALPWVAYAISRLWRPMPRELVDQASQNRDLAFSGVVGLMDLGWHTLAVLPLLVVGGAALLVPVGLIAVSQLWPPVTPFVSAAVTAILLFGLFAGPIAAIGVGFYLGLAGALASLGTMLGAIASWNRLPERWRVRGEAPPVTTLVSREQLERSTVRAIPDGLQSMMLTLVVPPVVGVATMMLAASATFACGWLVLFPLGSVNSRLGPSLLLAATAAALVTPSVLPAYLLTRLAVAWSVRPRSWIRVFSFHGIDAAGHALALLGSLTMAALLTVPVTVATALMLVTAWKGSAEAFGVGVITPVLIPPVFAGLSAALFPILLAASHFSAPIVASWLQGAEENAAATRAPR